ncbi:MAG: hypothetical protein HY721_17525 [Planctomycetes bacterium]|nr:hypothetical protein [Planctomycetota bacterium]
MGLACILTFLAQTSAGAPPAPGAGAEEARKLYVANTSGDTLSVIDLEREEVAREVKVGGHPHGLALSPDHGTLYISVESERGVPV